MFPDHINYLESKMFYYRLKRWNKTIGSHVEQLLQLQLFHHVFFARSLLFHGYVFLFLCTSTFCCPCHYLVSDEDLVILPSAQTYIKDKNKHSPVCPWWTGVITTVSHFALCNSTGYHDIVQGSAVARSGVLTSFTILITPSHHRVCSAWSLQPEAVRVQTDKC